MSTGFSDLKNITKFVDERVRSLGDDVRAAGWGSRESQSLRFKYLTKDFDLSGKTILDVGCGLGDIITHLNAMKIQNYKYLGLDISQNMISRCRELHSQKNVKFFHGTIFDHDFDDIDVSILSGALSYRYANAVSNAQATMKKMFHMSCDGVALNFLSTRVDYQLHKNQHYNPSEVLFWGLDLTNNVNLYHDYPLYEFTIVLKKF